ncbi:MAG: GGDEF domain-containing protein [Pseudanabaena sp. CAN_BIN31]|nr:GGDEF domain-containing protein [Pseudanabaena sp. CAN_BIN31]
MPNRRSFDLALEKELGRACRYQYPIALILIDIDYFKAYNDICIQQVALTLNSVVKRNADMAARYGGEEFVLLLPDVSLQNAEKLAAIALQAIVDLGIPHEASKVNPFVTISAGVSVCIPHLDTSPREIIQRTDQALYDAKVKGRNCFITNTHTK